MPGLCQGSFPKEATPQRLPGAGPPLGCVFVVMETRPFWRRGFLLHEVAMQNTGKEERAFPSAQGAQGLQGLPEVGVLLSLIQAEMPGPKLALSPGPPKTSHKALDGLLRLSAPQFPHL